MQTVSNEYAESMKSPLRERGYLQVDVVFANPKATRTAVVSCPTLASFSQTDSVIQQPVKDRYTYTALEENLIPADGTFYFPPETTDEKGIDTGITGSDIDTPITIDISFGGEAISNAKGFQVNFGKYYATSATATFKYTPSENETAYSHTITLKDGTSPIWKIKEDTGKFNSVTITVNSLCKTGHRVRISAIVFGFIQSFDNETITSSTLTASQSPVAETLPQTDFNMTILDTEGLFNPTSAFNLNDMYGEAMESYIKYGYQLPSGTIEWLAPYKLYLNEWSYTDSEASLTFVDGLRLWGESVSSDRYKTVLTAIDKDPTLTEAFYGVLESTSFADYTNTNDGFQIDNSLSKYTASEAYVFSGYLKECLQKIANAAHCTLSVARDGTIKIFPNTSTTPAMTLDEMMLLSKPISDIRENVTGLNVVWNRYIPRIRDRHTTLFASDIQASDVGTLTVDFDKWVWGNVTITIGDTEITSSDTSRNLEVNHWQISMSIFNTDVGSTLNITGWSIDPTESTYTLQTNNQRNILEWANPIVMSSDISAFAKWLWSWKKGRVYTYSYRGNPELDCGDIITQQITDTYSITGIIEELTLSFNGAFSGTLKLREV